MTYNILPNGDTIASPNELQAMLEAGEGLPFLGGVYDDGATPSKGGPGHNPSIGHGFNLRIDNDLALVLNKIYVGGVNVFTQAAKSGYDTKDVVNIFADIIFDFPSKTYPTISSLDTALDNELGSFFNLTPDESGNLFRLSALQAQTVLSELINGYTVGPYTVQPIYTQLSNYLIAHGLSAANVPPSNTSEALALASMFLNNPALIGPSLINALNEGNSAEAWYQIRYQSDAHDPNGGIEKRRFCESQVFGMNGGTSSLAQAEQDYQMLTEHRGAILGKKRRRCLRARCHCKWEPTLTLQISRIRFLTKPIAITASAGTASAR